jgi:hypothetical protein
MQSAPLALQGAFLPPCAFVPATIRSPAEMNIGPSSCLRLITFWLAAATVQVDCVIAPEKA